MLRITGGDFRGRRVQAPKTRHTRPTAEKVRQALFNVLEHMAVLSGARVADLFAGSGALGIEALSRGAHHVTFVESHGKTAGLIRSNLKTLEVDGSRWRVETQAVEGWLRNLAADSPVEVILADPPYADDLATITLAALARSAGVPEGAIVVMECARRNPPALPENLELIQSKSYGDTDIYFCRKRISDAITGPGDGEQ